MPLGDILSTTADGSGGFSEAAGADQSAAAIYAGTSTLATPGAATTPTWSNDQADLQHRIAIAKAVVPNLAADPTQLMAAARLNVPTEMLPQQLLQMNNVTRQADQVAYLGTLTKDQQQAIWGNLSEEQRRYLANIGFNPEPPGGGHGFMGFVGKAVHYGSQAVQWGTGINEARYAYRETNKATEALIGHQPLQQAAHYTVGEAAHYGVGLPVHAALSVYKPIQATASHLTRTGNYIDAQHPGQGWGDIGGVVSDWFSPSKWKEAWDHTADGERYIVKDAADHALSQIGGDQDLYSALLNMQAGDTIPELLARKGIDVNTSEGQEAAAQLYQRTNMPDARAAMQTIMRGKSSPGRDLARTAGLKPGSVEFNLLSGAGDALFSWYSDPAIVAGHAISGLRAVRYGLDAEDLTSRLAKLQAVYGQSLEMVPKFDAAGKLTSVEQVVDKATGLPMWEGGVRTGRSAPIFERANQLIADAFTNGDLRSIKQALPQGADMIQGLAEWNAMPGRAIKTADDVALYFSALETQTAIAAGKGLDLAAKVPSTPYLTNVNRATNAIKGIGRGVIDMANMGSWLRAGTPGLEDLVARAADHPGVQRLQAAADAYAARPDGATQFARDLVGRFLADPLAKALDSLVTHVPKGGVLNLANADGVQQFDRILRMGTYAHLPGPLQDTIYDLFMKGSPAVRRDLYIQFMGDMATGMGLDAERVVKGIPDAAKKFTQRYSAWSNDVYGDLRVALAPRADTSTMIAVPRFRELVAASTVNNFTSRFFAKTAEGLPGHFIDRIWAPATLLRFAFIPRVVGDETLAFILRNGPASWARAVAAPLAYNPDRLWEPSDFIARQVSRAVPSAISESDYGARLGAWWGHVQARISDQIGSTLGHFVPEDMQRIYAAKIGDPLGSFPMDELANQPTIRTGWTRVAAGHGHGFGANEADPRFDRIYSFGEGVGENTSWAIPTVQGSRFEKLERDLSWMQEGEQYVGGKVDAAITEAFAGRVNHMLSDPVYRGIAEELRRYASDAELKGIEAPFKSQGEFHSFLGAIRDLPEGMRRDLYEVIADGRPGRMDELAARWGSDGYANPMTDWVTSHMEGLDARERSLLMSAAETPAPIPPTPMPHPAAGIPATAAADYKRVVANAEAMGEDAWTVAPPESLQEYIDSKDVYDQHFLHGQGDSLAAQMQEFVHGPQKEMLGEEGYRNLGIYASTASRAEQHEAFGALMSSGVTEDPAYRARLDQHLADMGLPEEFAVYRGDRGEMFGKHEYVNVSVSPEVAGDFLRVENKVADSQQLSEYIVKRSEVRAVGYAGEEELIVPTSALQEAWPKAAAPAPHGLIGYSDPDFLRQRLTDRARELLDMPSLQRDLLGMSLYDDVAREVPLGHVQMYSLNGTPDALGALDVAAGRLGPSLFADSPDLSYEASNALKGLQDGYGASDLRALQARFQRVGQGSIPVSNFVDVKPETIQELIDVLTNRAAGVVDDATALDGLHVGYNHVRSDTLHAAAAPTAGLDVTGANRLGGTSFAMGNAGLVGSADYEQWLGRTLEQAKDDHAARIARELQQTLTHNGVPYEAQIDDLGNTVTRYRGGSVHHEIINPGLRDQVEVRHVSSMPNGYPTVTISPEPQIVGPGGLWSRIVNNGYGKVISPAIDALARGPMYLHHATQAYREAKAILTPLLYNPALEEAALAHLGGDRSALTDLGYALKSKLPGLRADDVALMGPEDWQETLDRWLSKSTNEINKADRLIGQELDFGEADARRVAGMNEGTRATLPRRSEGFQQARDENVRLHAALSSMDPRTASDVLAWSEHRTAVERELANVAAERAVKSMIPFIHDHQERSQFQEFARPFIPFQFAEEQFLKRWGRTFLYNPDAIGKAALTMKGLRDVGLIQRDQYGNEVYVVPGSQQFMDFMFRAVPHVFGMPPLVPIAGALTGSVQYSVPGFDISGRPFDFSPLIGVPVKELSQRFPEFVPTADRILGSRAKSETITDMIVPAQVRRFYEAATANDSNQRFASAMTSAMAQLQAGGHGPPQNATQDQIEEFVSRARNQARIILISQAIMGFFTPASPQVAYDGDLNPEYQQLLQSGMSLDDAAAAFLQAHPDATPYTVFGTQVPGKAQVPATHEALKYLVDNEGFIGRYQLAGGWLLPQSTSKDGFDQAAYQQELTHGLRVRKTPKQWITDSLYSEAAPAYFKSRDTYDAALLAAGNNAAQKAQITKSFQAWKTQYEQMHPVFASQVSLRGEEAKQTRSEVRREMRQALNDPELPAGTQADVLGQVLDSWDNYQAYLDSVKGDNRGVTTRANKRVAASFNDWGASFVDEHPEARAFWQRIIQPDIGG